MKHLTSIVIVLAIVWLIGCTAQQNKNASPMQNQKPESTADWVTDILAFQNRCGNPDYRKKEMGHDGKTIGSFVLTYPNRRVMVMFSHKNKVSWYDSLKFDQVTFFSFPEVLVIDQHTALSRLGCS